jgi:hypothetical protein
MLEQQPQFFEDFKRIIKELLFNGAKRSIQTLEGLTAL